MNILLFFKNHWKAVLIGIGLLVLVIWVNSITGMSNKFRDMLISQTEQNLKRILQLKEKYEKDCEDEITRIEKERQKLEKEKQDTRVEVERLKRIDKEKDERILVYERERQSIVISSDPDKLVDELHRMGYRSAYKRVYKSTNK